MHHIWERHPNLKYIEYLLLRLTLGYYYYRSQLPHSPLYLDFQKLKNVFFLTRRSSKLLNPWLPTKFPVLAFMIDKFYSYKCLGMLFFMPDFLVFILPCIYGQNQGVILPYKDNKILEYCKTTQNAFYRKNIFENPWYLFLLIFLAFIFFLMFLGLLKGLIGMCSKSVGELGLGLLVDLPKPLDKYREKQLAQLPVQYDLEGWPIHPFENERSVRILTKRTEFCLNIIFFLAYPLALCLQVGSLCCGKQSESEEERGCFCSVSMLKFNERIKKKMDGYKPVANDDIYEDDKKEEEDTNYVINQICQSQLSLQNGFEDKTKY